MSATSSLSKIAVANAPCSWGVTDDFPAEGPPPAYARVLDEIALAGYAGTELGDWGFLPNDPVTLRAELERRDLALAGAFVAIDLADPASHAGGEAAALRAAVLLSECAGPSSAPPCIVLAGAMTDRARVALAGRIGPEHSLSESQWQAVARGAERIALAVRDRTGLRTVFHQHAGSAVETPEETATLLELTDPELVGLCLDTGHCTYGGGDALEALRRYGPRVWHVHLKDCDGKVLARARSEGWDYFRAAGSRIFCELGRGVVDFPSILGELARVGYQGWAVVEDEVASGMGSPLESARRDRAFLRGLGL